MSESNAKKRQRRHFSPDDKAAILRRHLVDHVLKQSECSIAKCSCHRSGWANPVPFFDGVAFQADVDVPT